jgi:hypothetical protein
VRRASVPIDVGRDVTTIAATEAISVLVVLLAAAAIASAWLARRGVRAWSARQWFAAISTLAVIAAVTLFRDGIAVRFDPAALTTWSADGLRRLGDDPLGSSQFVLNVALFVPAAAVWTWLTKRPLGVVGRLALGSMLVECAQAVTGAGANDVADVVANTVGAVLGAGAALAVDTAVGGRAWSPRQRRAVAVVALVCGLVVVPAWFVGASRRQDRVARDLREHFAGTTRTEILALLASDPEAVFAAADARADGTTYLDDELVIRYPASFFSLHRCVYAVWTDRSVTFRNVSGRDCTRFIG